MKWLKFFRKRRKGQDGVHEGSPGPDDEDSEEEEEEDEPLPHKRTANAAGLGPSSAALQHKAPPRPSLEAWFEARRARTSIDVNNTTTTDRLTVCKAGVTTIINRTYIVIKHLGSGTYGQVKLAFNLRDRKLYAIKACRKSQYNSLSNAGSRSYNSLSRGRRSLNGLSSLLPQGPGSRDGPPMRASIDGHVGLHHASHSAGAGSQLGAFSTHANNLPHLATVTTTLTDLNTVSTAGLSTDDSHPFQAGQRLSQQLMPPPPPPTQAGGFQLPLPLLLQTAQTQPQLQLPGFGSNGGPEPAVFRTAVLRQHSRPFLALNGPAGDGPGPFSRFSAPAPGEGGLQGAGNSTSALPGCRPAAPHEAVGPSSGQGPARGSSEAFPNGLSAAQLQLAPLQHQAAGGGSGRRVSVDMCQGQQQAGSAAGGLLKPGGLGSGGCMPPRVPVTPGGSTASALTQHPVQPQPLGVPQPLAQAQQPQGQAPLQQQQAVQQHQLAVSSGGTSPETSSGTSGGRGTTGAAGPSTASHSLGSGTVGTKRQAPSAVPRSHYSSTGGMVARPHHHYHARGHSTGPDGAGSAGAALAQAGQTGRCVGLATQRRRAEEFVREIAIMKKLAHPNIVKLVEVIDDPASDNLLLVMEYVEGESLHPKRIDASHWDWVPEPEAWRRARDVLQGLDYLHYHEVVHGDLKPANLMLDNNTRQVKIVDFGSAVLSGARDRNASSSNMLAMGGAMSCTPAFRSPESLRAGYRPSFELDLWALGVTVYLWVFGQLPFNGAAPFLIYESIRRQDVKFPPAPTGHISTELLDFLKKVLEKDPTKRLDVVAALQHPWITGNGTAPLPIIERNTSLTPMEDDAVVVVGSTEGAASSGGGGGSGGSLHGQSGSGGGGNGRGASPMPRTTLSPECVRTVSQEELDRAISRIVGGHAISELMGMVFEEVRFPAKQPIIKAGDPVDTIFLIAQGEVEIYQELPPEEVALLLGGPPPSPPPHAAAAATHGGSGAVHGTHPVHPHLPMLQGCNNRADPQQQQHLLNRQRSGVAMVTSTGPSPASTPKHMTLDSKPLGSLLGDGFQPLVRALGGGPAPGHGGAAHPHGNGNGQGLSLQAVVAAAAVERTMSGIVATGAGGASGMLTGHGLSGLHSGRVGALQHEQGPLSGASLASFGRNTSMDFDTIMSQRGGSTGQRGSFEEMRTGTPGMLDTGNMVVGSPNSGMGSLLNGAMGGAPFVPPALAAAATTSLAQPIITGLDNSNFLLGGGHGGSGNEDDDEDFLVQGPHNQGPNSLFSMLFCSNEGQPHGSSKDKDRSQHGPGKDGGAVGHANGGNGGGPCGICCGHGNGGSRLRFMHSNSLTGAAIGSPSVPAGPPVIILAVKGPGDSLGLTSLEPRGGDNNGPSGTGTGAAGTATGTGSGTTTTGTGTGSGRASGDAAAATGSPRAAGDAAAATPAADESAEEGSPRPQKQPAGPPAGAGGPPTRPASTTGGLAAGGPSTGKDAGGGNGSVPTWRANVRTRGEVVAFKADVHNIRRLVATYPELEPAMKHIAVQQETDLMVAEALRQLRLASAGLQQHRHHHYHHHHHHREAHMQATHGHGAAQAGAAPHAQQPAAQPPAAVA